MLARLAACIEQCASVCLPVDMAQQADAHHSHVLAGKGEEERALCLDGILEEGLQRAQQVLLIA